MSEKEEYSVTVLSRDTITTYPKLGEEKEIVHITYVSSGLPPYTIRIPKDEWTSELEKIQVRASIESRLKKKKETYRV